MFRRQRSRILHVPSAAWRAREVRVALRGFASTGEVRALEEVASDILGIEVLAVGSARTGLYLILTGARPTLRRVLTPAYTCVAVPNAITSANLPIEWIDIDGLNIDLRLVGSRLRAGDAVLLQHTFGVPIDTTPLDGHAASLQIEDRAHRFDARDLRGDAAVFSLEHSKVVSGGMGGLVWIRDPGLRERVRVSRDQLAIPTSREARRVARTSATQRLIAEAPEMGGVTSLGRRLAYRLPQISAPATSEHERATGRIIPTQIHPLNARLARLSLARVRADIEHRQRLADVYERELGSLIPHPARGGLAVVRMPVVVDDAERVKAALRQSGFDLGERWFSAPVHPSGSPTSYEPGMAPRAELLADRILNLPMHALVTTKDAEIIARAVRRLAG